MNGHNGYVIEWPTSKLMEKAHFIDSYREIHPRREKISMSYMVYYGEE